MPRRQLSDPNESGSKLSAELLILCISSCFLNFCSFSLSKNSPSRLKQNHHCAKEILALSSVAFLPLGVGCGAWMGEAGNQASAQRRNAASEPVGSSVGGWQMGQMQRAQEAFWGMHCSQNKQNPTRLQGNGNCKGIADTLASLRSQQQTQGVPRFLTDCIVQLSHSSPHAKTSTRMLLRASRTDAICSHFSAGLVQRETQTMPFPRLQLLLPRCLYIPDRPFWQLLPMSPGEHSLMYKTNISSLVLVPCERRALGLSLVTGAQHVGILPGTRCQDAAEAMPARGLQAGQHSVDNASCTGKGVCLQD